jgi:quercetin dioxygenase-like cupin family protein
VFYLLSGKMELRVSNEDDLENAQVLFLEKGDTFHVETGMRHQMIALEDSELLEVSTQHFEDDSIRLKKGD